MAGMLRSLFYLNDVGNQMPDTALVSAVIADRFRKFLSFLLGTNDALRKFAQTEVPDDQRDGVFWLELGIARFSDIRERAGWRNDHFMSYLIAVHSWLTEPCSHFENAFAMVSLRRILETTDPHGEMETVDSAYLSAILQSLVGDSGFIAN